MANGDYRVNIERRLFFVEGIEKMAADPKPLMSFLLRSTRRCCFWDENTSTNRISLRPGTLDR